MILTKDGFGRFVPLRDRRFRGLPGENVKSDERFAVRLSMRMKSVPGPDSTFADGTGGNWGDQADEDPGAAGGPGKKKEASRGCWTASIAGRVTGNSGRRHRLPGRSHPSMGLLVRGNRLAGGVIRLGRCA